MLPRIAITLAVLALTAAPAGAEEALFEGDVLGGRCSYAFTAEDADKTWVGGLDCAGDDLTVTANGTYELTRVTLGNIVVSYRGLAKSWRVGRTYALPKSVEDEVERAEAWAAYAERLFGDAEKIGAAAMQISDRLGKLPDARDPLTISDAWQRYCEEVGPDEPMCKGVKGLFDAAPEDDNSTCPQLPPIPKWTVVCVPTIVYGRYTTPDAKPNLIVAPPFGLLLVVPLDMDRDDPFTAKMTVKGAFSVAGGGITGGSLRVSAASAGFAQAATGIVGTLTLEAASGAVRFGRAQIPAELGSVPLDTFTWARTIVVRAKSIGIDNGSTVSVAGGGELGGSGLADGAQRPGGGNEGWGGSYGGLGGFRFTGTHIAPWPSRSDAGWGDPFDPTAPGHAGAATRLGGAGGNGTAAGGVARLIAESGEISVNGKLTANGLDEAPIAAEGGGAGSGGSVNLRSKTLVGRGTITANGGSSCAFGTDPGTGDLAGCGGGTDSIGGSGGGGRIALRYATSTWKGGVQAFGGREYQPAGSSLNTSFGGAGTIFWLDTNTTSQPKQGKLVVQGGGETVPAGETPVPDGWSDRERDLVVTGGARVLARKLHFRDIEVAKGAAILSGPARARIATGSPDEPWDEHSWSDFCRGFCGGGPRLTVIAENRLRVAKTARIDATGRGFQGGRASTDRQKTAGDSPVRPRSTWGYGGSHAGRGGAASRGGGTAGRTYGIRTVPAKPGAGGGGDATAGGAPGGGAVRIEAQRLELSGRILADGGSSNGPTRDEPFTRWSLDGAGAGGSVFVLVQRLVGRGSIEADGGDACLPANRLWSGMRDEFDACSGQGDPEGNGGGGGGGRVSVCVTDSKIGWHGGLRARGGRDIGHVREAKGRGGGPGTTLLRRAKKGAKRC